MKLVKYFIICLVIAAQLASAAAAGVIGSYTVSSGPWNSSEELAWHTNLWFSDDAVYPKLALFNGPDTVNPPFMGSAEGIDVFSNIGQTFWIANDQDDADFSRVINLLAADVPAYAWIYLADDCSGGIGWPVSWPLVHSLQSYDVRRIGLTITSASHAIDPEAVYPHIYTMAVTCTFEGVPVVPEPPSVLILISGIGLLFGFTRRYRK